MKQCPNCHKMNSAYADKCRFCGHEIKWIPDDGTRDDDEPDVSDRKSASQDIETVDEERNASPDRISLDGIYDQLEEIKGRLSTGVNLFDVTMPFHRMVVLIIKLAFASIPAMAIMAMISFIVLLLFSGLFFRPIMYLFQTMGHGMH